MDETEGDAEGRRRTRRRATAAAGPPVPATAPEPAHAHEPAPAPMVPGGGTGSSPPVKNTPRRRRPARDSGERGLHDLVGSGRSQVGVSGALRARDVNRPDEHDLAEAERTTEIVRRNWRPEAG